jgi:hypothetical protein
MGDYPVAKSQKEIDCIYVILMVSIHERFTFDNAQIKKLKKIEKKLKKLKKITKFGDEKM